MRRMVGAGALLILPMVYATSAGANTVACGSTIVTNTVLQQDIGPCNGDGVVIGANGVTLDLNGYTIFGSAQAATARGVFINQRVNATVINGTIRNFGNGIAVAGSRNTSIINMAVTNNIAAPGSGGLGIEIFTSTQGTIQRSSVQGNGPIGGIAISISSLLVVENNVISGNTFTSTAGAAPYGIRVQGGDQISITNNVISGNAGHGIELFTDTKNSVVRHNTVYGNGFHRLPSTPTGDGIQVGRQAIRPVPFPLVQNLIENNVVRGNAANGIYVASQANTIRNNFAQGNARFVNSATAPSFDLQDRDPSCDSNAWHGNAFGSAFPACTTAP